MQIYHVLDGSSRWIPALLNGTDIKINFLISASGFVRDKKMQRESSLIRTVSDSLLFDSGILGFARSGKSEWLDKAFDVATLGLKLNADRIATVDVPSEPEILKLLGLTVEEARNITTKNAIEAMQDERLNGKRVISVQGWQLDDRRRSLEQLWPYIDEDKNAWVGNGSTCMLNPKNGLFTMYEWLCSELPDRHIHAWGIASPKWLAELERLGVSSGDSATAGYAAGRHEFICPETGSRIRGFSGQRNKWMAATDAFRNMQALELAYKSKSQKRENNTQERLFPLERILM